MKLVRLVTLIVLLAAGYSSAGAVTHLITFAGISYTPQGLQVAVGDVIRWEGDFSSHPLESVSVPNGAAPFSNSTGTSFEYTVQVAGNYGYRCTAHWQLGMVGGFNAADASVEGPDAEALLQLQAYPNPAFASVTIAFTLNESSNVRITLYDMNGRDLLHTENSYAPGENTAYMNVASLAVGSYYYRIETSEAILTKKFTIAR